MGCILFLVFLQVGLHELQPYLAKMQVGMIVPAIALLLAASPMTKAVERSSWERTNDERLMLGGSSMFKQPKWVHSYLKMYSLQ